MRLRGNGFAGSNASVVRPNAMATGQSGSGGTRPGCSQAAGCRRRRCARKRRRAGAGRRSTASTSRQWLRALDPWRLSSRAAQVRVGIGVRVSVGVSVVETAAGCSAGLIWAGVGLKVGLGVGGWVDGVRLVMGLHTSVSRHRRSGVYLTPERTLRGLARERWFARGAHLYGACAWRHFGARCVEGEAQLGRPVIGATVPAHREYTTHQQRTRVQPPPGQVGPHFARRRMHN